MTVGEFVLKQVCIGERRREPILFEKFFPPLIWGEFNDLCFIEFGFFLLCYQCTNDFFQAELLLCFIFHLYY